MKLQGYQDYRVTSFQGGMDTFNSEDNITDTSFVYLDNFTPDGTKLVTMNSSFNNSTLSGNYPITGMTSNNTDIFFIANWKLNAWNFEDGSRIYSNFNIGTANSTRYNMTSFFLGAIYVVICDTLQVENVRVYRYDPTAATKFIAHTITGLPPNPKYAVCKWDNGKLFLWNLPNSPANITYSYVSSLTQAVATPDAWLNFSLYPANGQIVWNGDSPITGFAVRQNTFYVFTRINVWKLAPWIDDGTTFNYKIEKETQTGAVGQYAICEKEQDVFYFDWRNIRRLSYESNGNTFSVKDVKMSSKMDGYIASLNQNQSDAIMVFDYPILYTYLKSNTNIGWIGQDVAVCYNVKSEGWNVSTSHSISSGTSYYLKWNGNKACVGSSLDSTLIQLNSSTWYLNSTALSKEFTTFDDVDYKRYVQLEMTGAITSGLTVYVDIFVDGRLIQTREINSWNLYTTTTGTATSGNSQAGSNGDEYSSLRPFAVRFEMFNSWRNFQYKIRKESYWVFELHATAFRWKAIEAYPIHY